MLTIFYDKTFTFHNKTPLPSPAENRYRQLAANPRRTRTQDCCEKVKRFVENPPPPSSPRLLHPGVDHLPPSDFLSWSVTGETSVSSFTSCAYFRRFTLILNLFGLVRKKSALVLIYTILHVCIKSISDIIRLC